MSGARDASERRRASAKRAEAAVEDYLRAEGFTIVARNLRLGPLEIDIVARKGALVVVVEVRTRGPGAYERGLASISKAKRDRLVRATERLWNESLRADASIERLRIDVASVTFDPCGQPSIEYIPAAITAD